MRLQRNAVAGLMCMILTAAPACGGGGADETSQTNPSTSAPTTTDPATATMTPTEATEGTTDDSPTGAGTSGPTTGDVGDPGLRQKCDEAIVGDYAAREALCPCLVGSGIHQDIASCIAFMQASADATEDACTCELYSQVPESEARLDCIMALQKELVTCLAGVVCPDDQTTAIGCQNTYNAKLLDCKGPKSLAGDVGLLCSMEAPFKCTSGEDVLLTWRCDFEADCMDGSDESGCPAPFMCADGMGVVPKSYKCDGVPDCSDDSDEAGCPTFMCKDGSIIPEAFKCDAFPDCADESDEGMAAMCPMFKCMSGEEIPAPYKCDGDPFCDDGSDEVDCTTFKCDDGEELPELVRCNGKKDCADYSDEIDCP